MTLLAQVGAIGLSTADYLVLLVYLCVIICLGIYLSRGKRDTEAYLLGGRSLPWWAVGASFFVSVTSTLSLVGVPGEGYQHGLGFGVFMLVSPIFAIATFFIFIRFFFKTRIFTPFAYLNDRFDTRVRSAAAGIVSLTRMFYLGLVLYSSAKVFEGAAGWPLWLTILLVSVVAIIYTVLGGIKAVVLVDVLQFVIMVSGLGILMTKLLCVIPSGAAGVVSYAAEHEHLITHSDQFFSLSPYVRGTIWMIGMQSLVTWMFFHSSDQIAIQRLLSTSGYKQAKKSMFTVVLIDLPVTGTLLFIGLALWVYYQIQTSGTAPKQADLALFQFVTQQLPTPVPGLIVAAMLAAVFSTLDSGINALATIFTKDFYLPFFRPEASEANQVRFARVMTLLTGVFAIGSALTIAWITESSNGQVLESAFLWLGAQSIVPGVFVLAVFSRRATANHALIALAAGALSVAGTMGWYFYEKLYCTETISHYLIGASGLVTTIVVGFVVSGFPRLGSQDKNICITKAN